MNCSQIVPKKKYYILSLFNKLSILILSNLKILSSSLNSHKAFTYTFF